MTSLMMTVRRSRGRVALAAAAFICGMTAAINAAVLQNIPTKRVRNCGRVDITEDSEGRPLALKPRLAMLPR
jgi:hypothetical protein